MGNRFIYANINLVSGICEGVVSAARQFTRENLIEIEVYNTAYIGKYYHDGAWWERIWNKYETIEHVDENGNVWTETRPVETAGYVDNEWVGGEV